MRCNNPKLDLVNMNAYIKFGENMSSSSQDIVCFVCLFDLILQSTQQSFSYAGRFFLGLTSTKLG